ncbi:hypothetical protein IKP85_07685 [bacterium]|nr:hypothetical protein [bacterium]
MSLRMRRISTIPRRQRTYSDMLKNSPILKKNVVELPRDDANNANHMMKNSKINAVDQWIFSILDKYNSFWQHHSYISKIAMYISEKTIRFLDAATFDKVLK